MGIRGKRSAVVAAILSGLIFAGCGGDDGEDGGNTTAAAPEELADVRTCAEDAGFEENSDETLTPNDQLLASMPIVAEDGGLNYVAEFVDEPSAQSYSESLDDSVVAGRFVVWDPSPPTGETFDALVACVGG